MTDLLKLLSRTIQPVRGYGVNAYRSKIGLPPRFAYSPLSETPEFSYLDGRGYAPLNHRQQARYERDQHFGRQVVKYMKQYDLAKKLVQKSKSSAKYFENESDKNLESNMNINK